MNNMRTEVFSQLKEKHLVTLRDPRLKGVVQSAKFEITESIYFHADDINSEIFNHALELY